MNRSDQLRQMARTANHPRTRNESQEKPYTTLYGLIQCPCGGWHHISGFWVGDDEFHNTPIKCHGIRAHGEKAEELCGRVLMCETCKRDDNCMILGEIVDSDPTQTEMRQA